MKRSSYLLKNLGLLTISNFASKILVFLLVPLYTSVLSTADYGTYDLTVSTVTLLYPLLTLNIVDAVMRYIMDKSHDNRKVVDIGNSFVCTSVIIFSIIIVVISSTGLWPAISGFELLIWLYFVVYVFNQYFIQIAKGLEKVIDIGIGGVLATVSLLGSNLLFLLVFKWGLKGFFIANCLSLGVPNLFYFIRLNAWKYIRRTAHIDPSLCKEMLIYCVPLIATTLGWWVNSTADKYTVTFICGIAANGLLSVSYKIPQILGTLQTIFTQAWQISAIKEYGEKGTAVFYGKTFNTINILICAVCSWLILLTKPLALILYQKDFYTAWRYVPFLIISCVLNSASGFLGPILSAKKASKPMAMSAVYGASANVVMNILFVYLIGIQGATIATVISSFIIYWVRKRAVGDEIKIVGYEIVLFTWVLLCIQAILEIYTSLWWAELILMAVMLVFNLRVIKDLLQMGKTMIKRK